MCGTGRFLIPLLDEDFNIHGFDASDHMLKCLQEKAKVKGLKPNVWKGFAQDFARLDKYDLIFIPAGSFCLMIDLEEVKIVLRKFYDHLKEGGIFLFEVETQEAVPPTGIWRGSLWPKLNGQKIILSHLASLHENICTSICKYELIEASTIIQTEVEELKIRIYNQEQLLQMLRAAGFSHIRTLPAYDLKQVANFQKESIIYECTK